MEIFGNSISDNDRLQKAIKHIKDIFDALKCLHSKDYVHRDIKPRSLVLTSSEKVTFVDAETLCKKSDETIYSGGTPFYWAPELFGQKNTINKSTNLFATDVYALGITLLFMIMPPSDLKKHLFPTTHNSTFYNNYEVLSEKYKNIIKAHLVSVFGDKIQLEHFFGQPNERLKLKGTEFSIKQMKSQ